MYQSALCKSEDNLRFSFSHVGPRDQIQTSQPGSQCLYPLRLLRGFFLSNFKLYLDVKMCYFHAMPAARGGQRRAGLAPWHWWL